MGNDALPKTEVLFFQQAGGRVPVREWLEELRRADQLGYDRCIARISQLAEFGHELRRPAADFLCDGVYELRARRGRVNFRILYCFHGRGVAVLLHALTKENRVPAVELQRAVDRKALLESDPTSHVHED